MAECTITSVANIFNDSPTSGAKNPWECHEFTHQTRFTVTGNFCTHTSWSIAGDIPLDISIDPATGVISGNVRVLNLQDHNIVNDITGKEDMKIDGSNWKQIKRPDSEYYDFHFTITRVYTIKNPLGVCDNSVTESTTSDVFIRVIKNNNIDNMMFSIEYLKPKETVFELPLANGNTKLVIQPHKFTIGDKKYTIDNVDEYVLEHPGPFSPCELETLLEG